MLSFLVLLVLILIVQQISYSTKTDARVSRNEETLIAMDQAIESVLLQVYEDLRADAGGGGGLLSQTASGEVSSGGATDSREDEWARPQRTEMNDLQLRILVQDEDSKLNVLSIMTLNEEEANKAFERLVRVIENARKGTALEIDSGAAREMATRMLEFINRRPDQILPQPLQISDRPNNPDIGFPFTLREMVAIDPELFTDDLFRDLRDEHDDVVHSLDAFLTVYSSLQEGQNQQQQQQPETPAPDPNPGPNNPGQQNPLGGAGQDEPAMPDGKVNINTAPPAVLTALMDERDLPYDFWDDVIEYRNEPQEEEDEEDVDEEDIPLNEYGDEVVPRKFFASLDDLGQIEDWINLEPIVRGEVRNLLKTQSSVFSIYITARRPTGEEEIEPETRREDVEREEAEGQGLVRTVRSVVWRQVSGNSEVEIIPLVRWEVLDYVPYEILDYPDEER
jgi:hypothetical protein